VGELRPSPSGLLEAQGLRSRVPLHGAPDSAKARRLARPVSPGCVMRSLHKPPSAASLLPPTRGRTEVGGMELSSPSIIGRFLSMFRGPFFGICASSSWALTRPPHPMPFCQVVSPDFLRRMCNFFSGRAGAGGDMILTRRSPSAPGFMLRPRHLRRRGGFRETVFIASRPPDGDTNATASRAQTVALETRPRGTERSRPVSCPRPFITHPHPRMFLFTPALSSANPQPKPRFPAFTYSAPPGSHLPP